MPLDFAILEFREMKMQLSLERALLAMIDKTALVAGVPVAGLVGWNLSHASSLATSRSAASAAFRSRLASIRVPTRSM